MRLNSHRKNLVATLAFPITPFPTLVIGDFKVHHPSTDPLEKHNSSELKVCFTYISRATEHEFILLNTPGVDTHFPLRTPSRPSIRW